MKRINLLSLFIAALLLSSCGGLEKMKEEASDLQFKCTPEVLEMHGGEIEYTINGDIPAEWFNKKAIVEFTPVLKYEGGEEVLESKTLQGEKVEANNKVIAYDMGGSVEFNGTIAYKDAMRVSEMEVRMTATIGDDQLELVPIKVADGVIATPTLVMVNPMPILYGNKFERVITKKEKADIHYVIQRSNIRSSEFENEDIKALEEFVTKTNEKENLNFKGVEIAAYASPDGPLDLNERLSKGRKSSADKFLSKIIDDAKISEEDAEKIYQYKTTAEDWDGFQKLVSESNIEDKDLILRVLSMYSDPVVREREIKNISATYEVLADDILPKLRRSDIYVSVDEVGYSDEELLDLAKNNPDTLNIEELLYAGALCKVYKDRLAIYQAAAEKYPGCLRAHNNVGYVLVKLDRIAEAKEAFQKANEIKAGDAIVTNNLGVIAMLEGDMEGAEKYFVEATDAGNAVDYNLGIKKIIDGDYDAAINYFQNHQTYNTALAMLLAGKPDNAIKTIDVVEEEHALNYYLKAIAGARLANEGVVMENIKLAVEKDSSLKELAKTDLEFAKYWENETFKSVVE